MTRTLQTVWLFVSLLLTSVSGIAGSEVCSPFGRCSYAADGDEEAQLKGLLEQEEMAIKNRNRWAKKGGWPLLIKVDQKTMDARKTSQAPAYSPSDLQNEVNGTLRFQIEVGVDGRVSAAIPENKVRIKPMGPGERIGARRRPIPAAERATAERLRSIAMNTQYEPVLRKGKPVNVQTIITVSEGVPTAVEGRNGGLKLF